MGTEICIKSILVEHRDGLVLVMDVGDLNLNFECDRIHFGFVEATNDCAFGEPTSMPDQAQNLLNWF